MPTRRRILVLTLACSGLLSVMSAVLATPGLACSPPPVAWRLRATADGTLFAGQRTIVLIGERLENAVISLTALRATGVAQHIPVTVLRTMEVELDLGGEQLVADAHYLLDIQVYPADPRPPVHMEFDVVTAPQLPEALGSLEVESTGTGEIIDGTCLTSYTGVQSLFALRAPNDVLQLARIASNRLLVDGLELYEGAPELRMFDLDGVARAFRIRASTSCSDWDQWHGGPTLARPADAVEVRLEPGIHQVVWQATFPDGTTLSSSPLEIDSRCPPGSARSDASIADEVTKQDAGVDAGDVSAHESEPSTGGCSIAARTANSPHPLFGWLLGTALFVRRIARRRSQVTTGRTKP